MKCAKLLASASLAVVIWGCYCLTATADVLGTCSGVGYCNAQYCNQYSGTCPSGTPFFFSNTYDHTNFNYCKGTAPGCPVNYSITCGKIGYYTGSSCPVYLRVCWVWMYPVANTC